MSSFQSKSPFFRPSDIITTTNAVATTISSLTLPTNSGITIGVIIIGRDPNTGDVCVFGKSVDIQTNNSSMVLSSADTKVPTANGSTIGATISFLNTSLTIYIQVTGVVSTTIVWSCWTETLLIVGS